MSLVRRKGRSSATGVRRSRAHESFQTAAECIGTIEPGYGLFAITRGQFSMIDAILACMDQVGPCRLSVWTWTIADYEVEVLTRMMVDKRISRGRLVIDGGARTKNADIIAHWVAHFGWDSVRYVMNHAKLATIETDKYRLLLRGSMNLNFNPRFEQLDITEGGEDFTLVRSIEDSLPILSPTTTGQKIYEASRVAEAFSMEQMEIFKGAKVFTL